MVSRGDEDVTSGPPSLRESPLVRRGVLVAMLLLFVTSGLVQASQDSITVDEAVDLTAGIVAVERHDLRMNPEHGLLHHVLPAVLPSLVADPVVGDWFDYTEDFVSANEAAGTLDDTLFWFRVLPLLLGAATGLLLYSLARALFGDTAGLLAAALWLTTPYVVGLAHLSSLDVSFTCALVALTLCSVRTLDDPSVAHVIGVGLTFGAALLVRHSGVVLVPAVVAVVAYACRAEARHALFAVLAVGLIAMGPIWVAYRAVDLNGVSGAPRDRFEQLVGVAHGTGVVPGLAVSAPLPLEWRAGLAYLFVTADDRPAYLLGEHWEGRRIGYFPESAADQAAVVRSCRRARRCGGMDPARTVDPKASRHVAGFARRVLCGVPGVTAAEPRPASGSAGAGAGVRRSGRGRVVGAPPAGGVADCWSVRHPVGCVRRGAPALLGVDAAAVRQRLPIRE